jgi:hypothetical protein
MWFVIYGLTFCTSKLLIEGGLDNSTLGEWNFFFAMVVLSIIFCSMMVLSKPLPTLSPRRPTFKLFGWRSMFNVTLGVGTYYIMLAIGLIVLHSYDDDWYQRCDLLKIGHQPFRWTFRSNNYDSAFWGLTAIAHLASLGFMFSLGFAHRQNVFKNWLLIIMVVLIWTWVLLNTWASGSMKKFSCIFSINCDTQTMMNLDVPFFSQFSNGSMGTCFLGPQLCEDKIALGDNYQYPNNYSGDPDNNKCQYDITGQSDYAFKEYDMGDGTKCFGPNNCFPYEFKLFMTILLVAGCSMMIGIYWLSMQWRPGRKLHFGRF